MPHGRPERTFLALNVSPGALLSPEVRAALPERPRGHRDRAHRARAVLDRGRRSTASCASCAARGARIALDDAGNGYAGLQQIIRVAPDILKLDRSLVHGVRDDPHRFALLEALISFSSTTRAAVCAEGVETLEDLAVLAALDVTYAQGWVLARPGAPWAALAPDAAIATSSEVREPVSGSWRARHVDAELPTLGDLITSLTAGQHTSCIRDIAAMIPTVLGGDDAAVSRIIPGEACLEDISRHDWSQPGERYYLDDYPSTKSSCAPAARDRSSPATRHRIPPRSRC